jgi:hypothetical protein
MARTYLRRKLETYQALAGINQNFHAISHHVHALEGMGFFPGPKMRVFQGLIRELQWARFEKMMTECTKRPARNEGEGTIQSTTAQ